MTIATYPAANSLVVYAKPLPLATADWAADVVAFAPVGSLNAHEGDVDTTKDYFVFVRAGAAPASTDSIDGAIGKDAAAAVLSAAQATPIHSDVRLINGAAATPATDIAKETSVQTLLSRITEPVAALWSNLIAMISGSDTTAAYTATALANAPSGGGGTGAETIQVPSPNVRGTLQLTSGDTYDGIGNDKAAWITGSDYTGWTGTLTIRTKQDAVVLSVAVVVASATLVTAEFTAPTGLVFEGCPGVWNGKYDVEMRKGASVKTIALGAVYINEDQTR